MVFRILCLTKNLTNSFQRLSISNGITGNLCRFNQLERGLLRPPTPIADSIRNTSFFNKLSGDNLWSSVSSISNAGKRRGRGRQARKNMTKNLNLGQFIGIGRKKVQWPGLNAPVSDGATIIYEKKLPDDPEWADKLYELRDRVRGGRRRKVSHEHRGYSGYRLPGRTIGPPDPIGEYSFDAFDSRCVEMKIVNTMKGNLGRYRRQSCYAVTGNGNGVAGFGLGKAIEAAAAIRKAKNRAGQKLIYIDLCDGHTVYHDFFCQFSFTKIYVYKKPEGYGLRCHRVIKTCCELIGIKNLHAKIEGATSPQNIVKAFFLGLLQMKNYQQIANDKGLHLVEFSKDTRYFPKIVASPAVCRTADEIKRNENVDFQQYCFNGKIALKKKKAPPFYAEYPSYKIHLRRKEKRRSLEPTKYDLWVRYGELKSFLADKYPECRANYKREKTDE